MNKNTCDKCGKPLNTHQQHDWIDHYAIPFAIISILISAVVIWMALS